MTRARKIARRGHPTKKRRPSRILAQLRHRLEEAESTIEAIRRGHVEALVVHTPEGDQVFTLHSADQPYRMIVEQMREGALTLDSNGGILFCNHRFAELVALPAERILGLPLASLVAADDEPKVQNLLKADTFRDEFQLRTADGGSNPAQISSAVLQIDEVRTIAAVVTDLTHERTTRGLRESNRLKDEFLATLSHELRTPLNAILGWTQVLLGGELSDPVRRAFELIARNAQAQAQLINDLVDMSRVTAGKLHLDLEPVPLIPLLETAVESMRTAAAAKRVTIHRLWPARRATVLADATRLQQVVWNLLSNAIKFTPSGGHIWAAAECSDQRVRIKITDTGAGIDPAFLPHVFDRFRQADNAKSRAYGGLGLGLSIVRELVELHGGEVGVQSLGPGRGSTFIVTLPASVADSVDPAPALAAARSLDGHRVMLLEDHADSRELLAAALQHAGAEVVAFGTAAEAFDALEHATPTVIVADIGLPGEDGYSFIRRVRAHALPMLRALPAIAVTAYATPADRAEALGAGFQHHLAKPLDPATIVQAIRELTSPVEVCTGQADGALDTFPPGT